MSDGSDGITRWRVRSRYIRRMTTPSEADQTATPGSQQATKKNPFTSALAWLSITFGVLAFVFVLTAAGVNAQASPESFVPSAQRDILYSWAGSSALAAFFTSIAWLVARAATWRPTD